MSAQWIRSAAVQRVIGSQRDADTGADVQTGGAEVDRLFEQGRNALRHSAGLVGIRSIEEHCELVPAQACHQVIASDDLTDAGAYLAQQRVPDLVPERVVDLLEVVQIDQQQGQAASGRGVVGQRGQCLLELVQKVATISESGELVGQCLVLVRIIQRPLLVQRQGHAGRCHRERRAGESEGNRADTLRVAQDEDEGARRQDDNQDDNAWGLLCER